jgi:hypothetical protein
MEKKFIVDSKDIQLIGCWWWYRIEVGCCGGEKEQVGRARGTYIVSKWVREVCVLRVMRKVELQAR